MTNLEKQKEHFKEHIATFTDYGKIKVLDFQKVTSNDYAIRFLFDEENYTLTISGDLGYLIAVNCRNMTFDGFWAFVNNTFYFEEKVKCHNRPFYHYDYKTADAQLEALITDNELTDKICEDLSIDSIDEFIDQVLDDFDSDSGIGSAGYDLASQYITDFWEKAGELGKESTGILDLYMLAFKLASAQLREAEV